MAEILRESLWGLSHYRYGEAYFGSCNGMRYRLAREPLFLAKDEADKIEPRLKASVWPEPYAYAYTDKELISEAFFSFSEDGMTQACRYFNDQLGSFSDDNP